MLERCKRIINALDYVRDLFGFSKTKAAVCARVYLQRLASAYGTYAFIDKRVT